MAYSETVKKLCFNLIKTCLLLILFLPLLVVDQFLFPFVFPRTIAFRILVEISLVCYLILALFDQRFRIRWSPLLVIMSALVSILALTAAVGPNFYHSFWSSVERSEGILTWLHLFGFVVIVLGVIRTQKEWNELFGAALIAGILQTVYVLGQYFNLPFALNTSGLRVSGSIGNPSFLAPYLVFIILITALRGLQTRGIKRYLLGALMLIDIFLLFQTHTRGAIIGFAVGVVFLIAVFLWQRNKQLAIVASSLIATALILLFALLPIVKKSDWAATHPILYKLALIPSLDITTQNRLIVWGVGLRGFADRPLLGWGLENFSIPFNTFFDPAITRDIGSNPWYDRAHNTVIEIAAASGIFGLVSYLALFLWSLVALLRTRDKKPPAENTLIAGFLVMYFVQNLFVFDTFSSYLMFFLMLAYIQSKTAIRAAEKLSAPRRRPLPLAYATIVVVALVPIMYYFNIRPVLANYQVVRAVTKDKSNPLAAQARFSKAFRYSPPQEEEYRFILSQYTRDRVRITGLNHETRPLVEFAIREIRKSIAASPYAIQNYLLLAEIYLVADALNPEYDTFAERVMLEALGRAPRRYQVYTTLGRIKMNQGRYEEGIAYFKQAIALNDAFAETHWNLGIAYILSGQQELARASLNAAAVRGYDIYEPKNIQKLLAAYRDANDVQATLDFLKGLSERFPDTAEYRGAYEELKMLYEQALEALNGHPTATPAAPPKI